MRSESPSRIYAADSPSPCHCLTPEHLVIFERLKIHPDLLAVAGVQSVGHVEARDWGFRLSSEPNLSGVVFPYCDPETGLRVTARLRLDSALPYAKYLCPYGDNRHLYFPPGAGQLLVDAFVPVVFVEAEKSSLALTALMARDGRKLLVIATGGCYGWRGKIGIESGPSGDRHDLRGPLPDLDRVRWRGRAAIILFDANARTNSQVRTARRKLAEELEARGASVKIADVPQLDGINGPDDLLAVSGDEAVWAILDSAQPSAETAKREAEAAIADLSADRMQDPSATLEAIAAVPDALIRTLQIGKVVALKIPGLTKEVVNHAVEARRAATSKERATAKERARHEQLVHLNVNPVQLIAELEKYYSARRHLPPDVAFVEALFAMNTYIFDAFDTTPYLLYDSATGGCGKTTTLERHEFVCARAYFSVDPSPAVLYRKIERDHPTFLLDEAKALQNHGDRSQELLTLFDAGYKRGATVPRCVEHGEELRDFSVYCPKVLARIGSFRGTLLDRGIVIHLEKAHGLRQKRRNVLLREVAPLKESLEAYALQFREQLERIYQNEPDDGYWPRLSGREGEIWGPLLCHARLAGPEAEARALKVALLYSREKGAVAIAEDRLLTRAEEVLEVLQKLTGEIFFPRDLVPALSEKESWGEYLADRKTDKARVTAVGAFFSHFRLGSRKHTDRGTQYNRQEAIEALERHMPESAASAEKGVKVSASATRHSDPTDYAACTSGRESSGHPSASQSTGHEGPNSPADTMTPPSGDPVRTIEEEL